MKKRMILMLLITGLLFGGIVAYQIFSAYMMKKYLSSGKVPPVTVSAMQAHYELWQPELHASGSLRAVQGIDVTSEVAGIIRNIYFKPGQAVKAGVVLIELNADADRAQLHSLEAASQLAKTTYQRNKALYAIQAVSKAALEIDAADLKSKQAQLTEQAANVAKKTIRAPFAGYLGISAVNLGQYLNPGDKIVTLQSLNPIYVDFSMPQQALVQIATGQSVVLTTDSYPGQRFTGKVTAIDPKIDSATRNVQVEATIPNQAAKLLPGMFAEVTVLTGKPQRFLTLPQTAVSFNSYGEIIYIVQQQGKDQQGKPLLVAKQSFVTTSETRGDQIAVIKGIKENDLVVTSGQLKLQNGSTVIIDNKVVPANSPAPVTIDE